MKCICITPSSNISQAYKVNALANDCTSEGGEGLSQRCTNKDKGFSPWGVAESVHLTCLIPHKPTPSFTEHFKRLENLLFVINSMYNCSFVFSSQGAPSKLTYASIVTLSATRQESPQVIMLQIRIFTVCQFLLKEPFSHTVQFDTPECYGRHKKS